MSSVIVAGNTSGSVSLTAPDVAGSTIITLPSTSGTMLTNKSAGTVLQVVNATFGTYVFTASSTYSDTGLTATITPTSATSKILVFVDMQCVLKNSNTSARFKLFRNSTEIRYLGDASGYTNTTAFNGIGSVSCSHLDSPSTTSATTYKIQFSSEANSSYVGINYNVTGGIPTSAITLMEIAA